MDLKELQKAADDGSVDTVLLTIADMEGRLQGKRLTARHFLDDVAERMRTQGLKSLPVTTSDGRLAGLLFRTDAERPLRS